MYNHWSEIVNQEEIIGNSPEMMQIKKSIPLIAKNDEHIVIFGEVGTEKMVVAKNIFTNSDRSKKVLILTNASQLNISFDNEIWKTISNVSNESSLDDGVKGTLVIQDIEKLDLERQTELLSIAQKVCKLLPGNTKVLKTDFRIIASATPNLFEAFKENQFDPELFLLLTSLTIKVPPLRERKQDIPQLFEYYLKKISAENHRAIPAINFEIFNQLLKHNWQGNVKELENTIRTLVLSSPEGQLDPAMLPFYKATEQFTQLELQNLGAAISHLEKELIEKALRRFAGNQSRAAQALSVSEPNLRYKMKRLGIRKKDYLLGN